MLQNPLVKSSLKVFLRLVLLAAIVVLGIVFVPDNFIANLQEKGAAVRQSVNNEAANRLPAIGRDLDVKYNAAKEELGTLYQTAKERFSSTVGKWVWEQINGKFQ